VTPAAESAARRRQLHDRQAKSHPTAAAIKRSTSRHDPSLRVAVTTAHAEAPDAVTRVLERERFAFQLARMQSETPGSLYPPLKTYCANAWRNSSFIRYCSSWVASTQALENMPHISVERRTCSFTLG
jgi:hypothetical protein